MIRHLLIPSLVVSAVHLLFSTPVFSADPWTLRDSESAGLIPGCETRSNIGAKDSQSLALLYVHGFSACPIDLEPIPSQLNSQGVGEQATIGIGSRISLRMSGHGIAGTEGLLLGSSEKWKAEVEEAAGYLKNSSKGLVLMGTSTGGSLVTAYALKNPDKVSGLILISPNFGLPRWDTELLLLPFGIGKWLTRLFVGQYREWKAISDLQQKYWTTKYPASVLVEMMKAVEASRSGDFENFNKPVLVIYCENDNVVDAKAIHKYFSRFGSKKKQMIQGPCDEDPHVLAGEILSPKSTPKVQELIRGFIQNL